MDGRIRLNAQTAVTLPILFLRKQEMLSRALVGLDIGATKSFRLRDVQFCDTFCRQA